MDIKISEKINTVLDKLRQSGHEAFVVGGCVRDALMGREPQDWDICTSATPDEIKECMCGFATVDIGIMHGTVAVIIGGEPVEITTYRVDGKYADNRHPDKVTFTENIEADLARRDFTMNAIAYNPEIGFVDPFGGMRAVSEGRIEAVGNASERFREDALRILRGLRFASTLEFCVEPKTEKALFDEAHLLKNISAPRHMSEFKKLLTGKNAAEVVERYHAVMAEIIPEMNKTEVVGNAAFLETAPTDMAIRTALLFGEYTGSAVEKLPFDRRTKEDALFLRIENSRMPERLSMKEIRILISMHGYERTLLLLKYRSAYGMGKACGAPELYNDIVKDGLCCRIDELKLSGGDLMEIGVSPGPEIGRILRELLHNVIDGKLENEKRALLSEARILAERDLKEDLCILAKEDE